MTGRFVKGRGLGMSGFTRLREVEWKGNRQRGGFLLWVLNVSCVTEGFFSLCVEGGREGGW
jgi:hypothetical protein